MKNIGTYGGQFLLVTLFILFTGSKVKAQHADFTGTWKLNPEKSEYTGLSLANLFDKMVIKQNNKQLIIGSLRGDTQTIATLNLDGTEVKSKITNPSRDRVTYFRWLDARSYEINAIDNTGSEIYTSLTKTSLSEDGKTIVMTSEIDYKSRGAWKTKLILEKE